MAKWVQGLLRTHVFSSSQFFLTMDKIHEVAAQILAAVHPAPMTLEALIDPWQTQPYGRQLQYVQGALFAIGFFLFLVFMIATMARCLWNGCGGLKPDSFGYSSTTRACTLFWYILLGLCAMGLGVLGLVSTTQMSKSLGDALNSYDQALPAMAPEQQSAMQSIIDENQDVFDQVMNNNFSVVFADAVRFSVPVVMEKVNMTEDAAILDSTMKNVQQLLDEAEKHRQNLVVISTTTLPEYNQTSDPNAPQIRGLWSQLYSYYDTTVITDVLKEVTKNMPTSSVTEQVDALPEELKSAINKVGIDANNVTVGIERCKMASSMGIVVSEGSEGMVRFSKVVSYLRPVQSILVPILYAVIALVLFGTLSGCLAWPTSASNWMHVTALTFVVGIVAYFTLNGFLVPNAVIVNDACLQTELFFPGQPSSASLTAFQSIPACSACEIPHLTENWDQYQKNVQSKISSELSWEQLPIAETLGEITRAHDATRHRGRVSAPAAQAPWASDLEILRGQNPQIAEQFDQLGFDLMLNSIQLFNNYVMIKGNMTQVKHSLKKMNSTLARIEKDLESDMQKQLNFDLNSYKNQLNSTSFQMASAGNGTQACQAQVSGLSRNQTETNFQEFQANLCEGAIRGMDVTWFSQLIVSVVLAPLTVLAMKSTKVIGFTQ